MKSELEFYKELASELKPQGYRCFLYDENYALWLYMITPNNSFLYIDNAEFGGYNICFEYVPNENFGNGCQCNEEPLYEITKAELDKAESYGRNYSIVSKRWHTVKRPEYYSDAFEGLKSRWCFDKLIEL